MSYNPIENYIDRMIIYENINQLKEKYRQIILLYYWWGYKDMEIGKILGLSQQVVNYRRKIATKIIKEKIRESRFVG